jgi:hypothetical protein
VALFFLLRVSPTGFTAEVLTRQLGLHVYHFHPLWRTFMVFLYGIFFMALGLRRPGCLLSRRAARGEVLQYLTRSA